MRSLILGLGRGQRVFVDMIMAPFRDEEIKRSKISVSKKHFVSKSREKRIYYNKCTDELIIQFGFKGGVVDIDYIGRMDIPFVLRVNEVAFDELVLLIRFSPPLHPFLE